MITASIFNEVIDGECHSGLLHIKHEDFTKRKAAVTLVNGTPCHLSFHQWSVRTRYDVFKLLLGNHYFCLLHLWSWTSSGTASRSRTTQNVFFNEPSRMLFFISLVLTQMTSAFFSMVILNSVAAMFFSRKLFGSDDVFNLTDLSCFACCVFISEFDDAS